MGGCSFFGVPLKPKTEFAPSEKTPTSGFVSVSTPRFEDRGIRILWA